MHMCTTKPRAISFLQRVSMKKPPQHSQPPTHIVAQPRRSSEKLSRRESLRKKSADKPLSKRNENNKKPQRGMVAQLSNPYLFFVFPKVRRGRPLAPRKLKLSFSSRPEAQPLFVQHIKTYTQTLRKISTEET